MSASAKPRPRKTLLRDQSGAAALEFALIIPVFIALVTAVFQVGWAQHKVSSIRYAMELTARDLIVNPNMSLATVDAKVRSKLTGGADPNITLTMSSANVSGVKKIQMTGSYTSSIEVFFLPAFPFTWSTTVTTSAPIT